MSTESKIFLMFMTENINTYPGVHKVIEEILKIGMRISFWSETLLFETDFISFWFVSEDNMTMKKLPMSHGERWYSYLTQNKIKHGIDKCIDFKGLNATVSLATAMK